MRDWAIQRGDEVRLASVIGRWLLCRPACLLRRRPTPPQRAYLQRELQVWWVKSQDGDARGLATSCFEPQIAASRIQKTGVMVPLYHPPADLNQRKPHWTREQQDTLPAAHAAPLGKEIAYVASPLDALILQIQGSGRLRVIKPNGSVRLLRLAFAGHNDQP